MLQSILTDLDRVIEARKIKGGKWRRIWKQTEELLELIWAAIFGTEDDFQDELGDCIIAPMITARGMHYDPLALVARKLDKMQRQYPWRDHPDSVDELQAIVILHDIGHTHHCACRQIWGDGECECKISTPSSTDEEWSRAGWVKEETL